MLRRVDLATTSVNTSVSGVCGLEAQLVLAGALLLHHW
jgi:hypothetical protein